MVEWLESEQHMIYQQVTFYITHSVGKTIENTCIYIVKPQTKAVNMARFRLQSNYAHGTYVQYYT